MSKKYKLFRGTAWHPVLTEYELEQHELELSSKDYYGHVKIGENIDVDENGVISIKEASTQEKGIVQIVDDLITDDSTKVLSAKQGYLIKQMIENIDTSGGSGNTGGSNVVVEDSLTSTSKNNALSADKGRELKVLADTLENNKASKSELQDLQNFVVGNITTNGIPVTQAEKNIWNSKSDFGGNYNDLSNKPLIPTLSDSLTSTSTLEASTANVARQLNNKITNAENRIGDLENNQFSGNYEDLTNKPTIPSPTVLNDTVTSTSTTEGSTANVAKTLNDKISSLETRVENIETNGTGGNGSGGTSDIIVEDSLVSTSTVNALSANKGKELNENYTTLANKVQTLEGKIDTLENTSSNLTWSAFEF